MNGFNEQREKEGPWEVYLSNGKLSWKGNYVHGLRRGLYLGHPLNGELRDKKYYL